MRLQGEYQRGSLFTDISTEVQGDLDNLPDVSGEWRKARRHPALFNSLSLSGLRRAQRCREVGALLGPDGLGMEEAQVKRKEKKGRREGKEVGMKGEMEGQGKKEGEGRRADVVAQAMHQAAPRQGRKDPNLELHQKPHQGGQSK